MTHVLILVPGDAIVESDTKYNIVYNNCKSIVYRFMLFSNYFAGKKKYVGKLRNVAEYKSGDPTVQFPESDDENQDFGHPEGGNVHVQRKWLSDI
jgi:hypothetical protein